MAACRKCGGRGWVWAFAGKRDCPACGGTGVVADVGIEHRYR